MFLGKCTFPSNRILVHPAHTRTHTHNAHVSTPQSPHVASLPVGLPVRNIPQPQGMGGAQEQPQGCKVQVYNLFVCRDKQTFLALFINSYSPFSTRKILVLCSGSAKPHREGVVKAPSQWPPTLPQCPCPPQALHKPVPVWTVPVQIWHILVWGWFFLLISPSSFLFFVFVQKLPQAESMVELDGFVCTFLLKIFNSAMAFSTPLWCFSNWVVIRTGIYLISLAISKSLPQY